MGWNAFGWTEDKITITKSSLLDFSQNRRKFTIDDVLKYYCYIHKVEGKNGKDKKKLIKVQVDTKLKILIDKGYLKKEDKYITINAK
ncbi:hypothetical protein LCGC14_0878970 [marine sediment metagenome]|uniref:Uncharacterized protein n=1 Tax=marine sediment metagenome TaxID=412755 RepID=A0A0F9P7C3_9ZZZZ